ncbi:reprolysin-like metallopeptidase [Flavobacterium sp. HNIBRBA15423]|uniref:reprolysin-like metallopeptidase n=1 Tax=Flavobacterium sp. HNIBRBA15423 TaxID=3458683 RepID=UPI004043E24A
MKKTILSLFLFFSILQIYSQKENGWKRIERTTFNDAEKIRKSSLPLEYELFEFDYEKFKSNLINVPKRDEFLGVSNVIVSIPNVVGEMEEYRIVEASTFEDDLQSQFPEIRSFAGQGVTNPSNTIRFSISPYNGISAIVRSGSKESTFIIDPISIDYKTVIVFDKSKSGKSEGKFSCTTDESIQKFGYPNEVMDNSFKNADDSQLRIFRMAQSCTAEYANYFGATSAAQVNLVLAAFNATYTRVNALFESDFNCTMQLIATTTNVIYYNAGTDPYSSSANLGNWNSELQATLTSVIGDSNYDIGHLFGADGGGGNAGCIGCVCETGKGSAYTSPSDAIPQGDNFDVDYVAHEIGHQLGGNHTFSMSTENNSVNMEPGSGVTIMGYAGITGATDVASHSIPIFHAGSIEQITTNIKSKSCPTIVNVSNAVPIPSAPASKIVPRGTAFKLIGTATDADSGDILSYNWEQIDDATTVGAVASYPTETKTNGANFRSFMPKNNGVRYFPRLEDHVANGIVGNQWEIIPNNPSANRTLKFRLTVRDNKAGGGANESVDTDVTFDSTKGPFLVTSQNALGISYTQGSTQTITWSVNSTNTMTGASNVNIKLSIDGGQTFPTVLLANTPNDGSEVVTIPNVSAPYCRILIEPTGNDFYAINSQDFAIGYTVTSICNSYTATPNGNIPQGSYAGWSVNIPDSFTISDANITTTITHSRRNQIYAFVRSPGTTFVDVDLFQGGSCGNAITNLNGTFDDESSNAAACGVTDNFGNMKPLVPLTAFDGLNSAGTWIFAVADAVTDGRTGTLNSFTIQLCYKQITETPNACGVITTTWNGTSWSNGVPLKNVAAIINGNYISTGDLEACSFTVNSGFNVTIVSGHTLTIGNEVVVNGTGVLTIENNAALVQIDATAVNSGNIVVNRNSTPMIRQDYTAWTSPVVGQQLLAFSPNTVLTRFYEYLYTGISTPTAYQSVTPTNNFTIGKGYMIRVDNNWSTTIPTVYNGQFTGIPFNGDLTVSLGKGYNLIGNPYPSPIDADRFLQDNATTVGALYFWTHTVPVTGGVYPVNNYASYTTLGGTASAAGGAIPNGKIQTGQGFFVRAYDFGNANFSNFQRLNASLSTQFFRTSSIQTNSEVHRYWLNLNGNSDAYNQILVGYKEGATSGIDNTIDGKTLDSSNNTYLYSIINDDEFVIQGKGLPFNNDDIVVLGLKAELSGSYSIGIEGFDGLFDNQDIYLKDKYTNVVHDIKQSSYSFTTQAGTFNDRFEVVYKNITLDSNVFVNDDEVIIFSQNNLITINSEKEVIKSISIFDVLGRILIDNENVNQNSLSINTMQSTNQALFVKITLSNGQIVNKKIIF